MLSDLWRWLRSDTGSQVDRSFQHTWPLPAWLTALLLIGVVVIVLYCYRRGGAGASHPRWLPWLRVGALLGLVWMMVGGTWQRYDTELPELLLVIDHSLSMSHLDGAAGTTQEGEARLEQVRSLLLADDARRLSELNERFEVRTFLVADDLRELTEETAAELREVKINAANQQQNATRLGDGISQLLLRQRSRPTAAIVLVTDGVNTVGQSLESVGHEARRRRVPLWFIGVGDRNIGADLAVSDIVHPATVFPGDLARLDAKLTVQGEAAGQTPVKARLLQGGRVLEEIDVSLIADADQANGNGASVDTPSRTLPLTVHYRAEESGTFPLTIEVDALPGETNLNNNRIDSEIVVRDETIRVLMAFGHPSFEFQFLKNLLGQGLRRDERRSAFDLATVLQDSDPEYANLDADAVRVFPATREELMARDVIILGDLDPRAFSQSQLEAIHDFVSERGGALVVLSGPTYTPLAWQDTPIEPLLPVELATAEVPAPDAHLDRELSARLTLLGADAAHLQLTDRAADNAVAWDRMPPLYWSVKAAPRAGARTLVSHANAPGVPLICSRFYGAGMVLFHATDESFRWSAHPEGKQFYARYWLQSLRHLCRAKLGESDEVELSSDAEVYSRGEPVRFQVRFEDSRAAPADDEGVLVVMESAGRRWQTRLLRVDGRRELFGGQMLELPEGDYRAWLAEPVVEGELPNCEFRIARPQTEMTRLTIDFEAMSRAAQSSGGQAAMLPQWDEVLAELPAGRQLRVSPLPPQPIWNSPWLAAIVVGLLSAEWILRRQEGLR